MLSTTASSNVTRVVFVSIAGSSEYVIASDTAAPFSVSWATGGWVPDGSYVVRFDAYAGATKVASASRRVHVSN
jgi:hypothetical protein